MRKIALTFISTLMILMIVSCGGNKEEKKSELKNDSDTASPKEANTPITKTYFSDLSAADTCIPHIAIIFLDPKTDCKAATIELQPSLADCKAFFKEDATAKKAFDKYSKEFGQENNTIKPKAGQKESIIAFATTEELNKKTWKGKVNELFPGGYHNAALIMKPGVKVFVIKFIDHNKTTGISYDGFSYVNNHWKIFPKPWSVTK
jgi:hypothetical protein